MSRQSLVAAVFLVVSIRPVALFGQSQFVNDLIGAMVSAGFNFNETDKLRMGKLLADKGIVNCQVVEWGKSVDAKRLSSTDRFSFLEERVKEFETKVNLVSRRLGSLVGQTKQSHDLARNIARDNDMETILEKVMPSLKSMVDKVKSDMQDELELTRIISGEYRSKFDSLCKKVNSIDARLSILEQQQSQQGGRSSRRLPPEGDESKGRPPAPPIENNGVIYPDRIVSDRSLLCPAAMMIKKCYDYLPLEEVNGQLVRRQYHGDLYSDCNGYILVTHVKTGGNAVNAYPYSYQVQPAPSMGPTLAPSLPSR